MGVVVVALLSGRLGQLGELYAVLCARISGGIIWQAAVAGPTLDTACHIHVLPLLVMVVLRANVVLHRGAYMLLVVEGAAHEGRRMSYPSATTSCTAAVHGSGYPPRAPPPLSMRAVGGAAHSLLGTVH